MDDSKKNMIYDASKKNVLVAYLLYFFFGWYFQFHRFYAGNKIIAVLLILLPLVGFGLGPDIGSYLIMFWMLVGFFDIFYIPFMVKKKNLEIINAL